jgi:E3 ubiquitin-protein ligase RNF14
MSWQSIYPEYVSSRINEGTLKLEIPVEFDHSQNVVIMGDTPSAGTETVSVSTLPPLLIHVALPSAYPLQEGPQVSFIRATHLWHPGIGALAKHLTEMWQPGDSVLYSWIEYLRTGDFLETLGMQCGVDSDIK